MITGRGMQAFLEHLEDAGVLIPKPGQLQTWGGKISRKFPDATDVDLARAADVLDETPGFVRLGDLVNFLKGTPSEVERIDRANRLTLVSAPSHGGPLYPDGDLTPSEYVTWLRSAQAFAMDAHPDMTPAQINAAARQRGYDAAGVPAPPPEITAPRAQPKQPASNRPKRNTWTQPT